MKGNLQAYFLPEGAGRLDRVTLAFWKAWDGWLRPILTAAATMAAVAVLVALLSSVGEGPVKDRPWRFLIRWAPVPSPGVGLVRDASEWAFAWSIGAQVLTAALSVVAVSRILRRNRWPVLVGAGGGVIAVTAHLWTGHLLSLHPLGNGALFVSMAGGQTARLVVPVIVHAGPIANGLAVAALWSPIVFGTAVGWLIQRRREAKDTPRSLPRG